MSLRCPHCGAEDVWTDRLVMLAVQLALEGAALELDNRGHTEAAHIVRGYDPEPTRHGPGGPLP